MKIFNYKDKSFIEKLNFFIDQRNNFNIGNDKLEKEVKKIINEVREKGDKALIKYSKKFDKINLDKNELKIPFEILKSYKGKIDQNIFQSFKIAIKNIKKFHKKQFPKNYQLIQNNIKTGTIWKSIESVGLYIPGGNAVYPSSLLMNTIPAQIAGVKRIVVTTPSQNGKFNPYLLALLDLLGINEVYQIGGSQAIAALAYGTETIKPVNKIFGPGNSYVTIAKKNVFGKVGIDLIAGPSEIVVVANNNNNPEWVASDMIAQAEHDEKAQSILITDSIIFKNRVIKSINNLVNQIPKKKNSEEKFKKL